VADLTLLENLNGGVFLGICMHQRVVLQVLLALCTMATADQPVYDIAIVGGGLAGLVLAHRLKHLDKSVVLLEAHSVRLGGRLQNAANNTIDVDMGGAWVWLDHQPQMRELIAELGLSTFPQPDEGSHGSSYRVQGGAAAIISKLAEGLMPANTEDSGAGAGAGLGVAECTGTGRGASVPTCGAPVAVKLGFAVEAVSLDGEYVAGEKCITLSAAGAAVMEEGVTFRVRARRAVFAMPPRLVAERVTFAPALPAVHTKAMRAARTWMAGVTKVSLVYSKRHWSLGSASNGGLRGAPAFQFYDGSTMDGIGAREFC
jgi:monoamine oxidase